MRPETVLLITLCAVMLIFGIVGWIAFRVDKRLRQRAAGIVSSGDSGGGTSVVVGVSCGDGGAGCAS